MANCSVCNSSNTKSISNGSVLCNLCGNCYLQNLPKCEGSCPRRSVEFIASCGEEELVKDYCTIVAEFEGKGESVCITPESLIIAAYKNVENVVACPRVEDYLDMYNAAVRAINTDQQMQLLRPMTALVTHCGNFQYSTPPNYKKAMSLSNEIPGCNNGCKTRKYNYVPVELFYGSDIPENYNIRGGKIILKDPVTCHCPKEPPPSVLQLDYWAKLPESLTISECLEIPEEHQVAIEYALSMKIALKKNNNPRAYTEYARLYESFKGEHTNYDSYIQDQPTFSRHSANINWLGWS